MEMERCDKRGGHTPVLKPHPTNFSNYTHITWGYSFSWCGEEGVGFFFDKIEPEILSPFKSHDWEIRKGQNSAYCLIRDTNVGENLIVHVQKITDEKTR